MKKLRYCLEYIAYSFLMFVFEKLPVSAASDLGGFIARTLGPRLAVSRKARRHIHLAFPGISEDETERIVKGMWNNLGRTFAEYPHLETIAQQHIVFTNPEAIEKLEKVSGGCIVFNGHLGNWEVPPAVMAVRGQTIDVIYRAPNNNFIESSLKRMRSLNGRIHTHAKSASGTRALLKALKQGRILGILIDQKYNEGISVPFFGHPAMTSTAFVTMGQKYDCPVVPARIVRTKGLNFEITLYDPLRLFNKNGEPRNPKDVVIDAHRHLEQWITEKPEQWLWLHKRWGNS